MRSRALRILELALLVPTLPLLRTMTSEPRDLARLTAQHEGFAARRQVPPGITGLAQVCQAQGAEVTARLDAEYAAGANPRRCLPSSASCPRRCRTSTFPRWCC